MELVDLYDENRIPLNKTAERHARKKPGELRVVVHICIFNSRGQMLIQQRSERKSAWAKRWDVSAAGGVNAGESSRQSAEREVWEELGLRVDLSGRRPHVTVNFPAGFDDFYLLERDVDLKELTLQKEEVSAVRWADEAEVIELLRKGEFIGYPEHFLHYLFESRRSFGF